MINDRFLELTQLGKSYDTPAGEAVIVRDFNLRVHEGEFVCLIGHSGCGKSTVLSILMGLAEPTAGGVILAGREIVGPGLDRGVVFQSPALLPWLSARDNVRLAVDQAKWQLRRADREQIVERHLARVGLSDAGDMRPDEMSAGMRQRVGIARAFAVEPKVLLLDEPFSLLDALTRMELQDELLHLWERDQKTVVMVTHDVDEALLLADRVIMMTSGPAATVGDILTVPLPRPRDRAALLEDASYYTAREHLLGFLEEAAPVAGDAPSDASRETVAATADVLSDVPGEAAAVVPAAPEVRRRTARAASAATAPIVLTCGDAASAIEPWLVLPGAEEPAV